MRSYSVPTVMALVALVQLVFVQTAGLNSWRGGGFGMYGSFHPRQNEAWLTRLDTDQQQRYAKFGGTKDRYSAAIRPALTWVNKRCLRTFLDSLPDAEAKQLQIQIWQLDFDPHTLQLSRRMLIELTGDEVDPSP